MAKKYELAVKIGTYITKERVEKNRYENIGEIHSGREGGFYARLNAFRVLGIAMSAIARGDDSFLVSLFTPKSDSPQQDLNLKPSQPAQYPVDNFDHFDDIPGL